MAFVVFTSISLHKGMALLAPAAGDLLLLKYMLNNVTPSNVELHLYSNNATPAEADVLSNYTEVSAGLGYTATTLAGNQWTCAAGVQGATGTYASQVFTFTAAATCYGYFVTTTGKGNLLYAERFAGAPFTLPASTTSTLTVTPSISLD